MLVPEGEIGIKFGKGVIAVVSVGQWRSVSRFEKNGAPFHLVQIEVDYSHRRSGPTVLILKKSSVQINSSF